MLVGFLPPGSGGWAKYSLVPFGSIIPFPSVYPSPRASFPGQHLRARKEGRKVDKAGVTSLPAHRVHPRTRRRKIPFWRGGTAAVNEGIVETVYPVWRASPAASYLPYFATRKEHLLQRKPQTEALHVALKIILDVDNDKIYQPEKFQCEILWIVDYTKMIKFVRFYSFEMCTTPYSRIHTFVIFVQCKVLKISHWDFTCL
jgi:hypothetical protein